MLQDIESDVCQPIDVDFLNKITLLSENTINGQEKLECAHFEKPPKQQYIEK